MTRRKSSTLKWVPNWHSEWGFCKSFANAFFHTGNKKGPSSRWALLYRQQDRILFGRRDWTRTSDPHHVKVVL